MSTRGWRKWSAFLLFTGAVGCASTDALCDAACEEWRTCTQVKGNTVNYPYETCFAECKEEGDWGPFYLNCLESYDRCPELGNQCG